MKQLSLPELGTKSRFAAAGYGLIILIWLSLEDNGVLPAVVLGSGLAIFGSLFSLLYIFGGKVFSSRQAFIGITVLGAIIGAFSAISTTFLMFFKSSWHAHQFLDYPPAMMGAMISRTPAWALAGLLIGLSVGIFIVLKNNELEIKYD